MTGVTAAPVNPHPLSRIPTMHSAGFQRRQADTGDGWRRRAQPWLGTLVEVSLQCDADAFDALATLAFEQIARHHRSMSFHEDGSDLRAIARAHAGQRLMVAPETWTVLRAAIDLEAQSQGCFNAAIAPELVRRGLLPAPAGDAAPLATSARGALTLEADHTVLVRQPVWLDLGGIAKGAAVDASLAAVRAAGASAAIVNAGGDLAVFGQEDVPIDIVSPARQRVRAGRLGDGAMATSGPFLPDSALVLPDSALVLPGDSQAVWAARAVTVVAPNCITADALTKVLAALGHAAAPLLARHAARGFSVDEAGYIDVVGAAE